MRGRQSRPEYASKEAEARWQPPSRHQVLRDCFCRVATSPAPEPKR